MDVNAEIGWRVIWNTEEPTSDPRGLIFQASTFAQSGDLESLWKFMRGLTNGERRVLGVVIDRLKSSFEDTGA